MTVRRMDNVGIVVEDLDAAVAFFTDPVGRRLGWACSGPNYPRGGSLMDRTITRRGARVGAVLLPVALLLGAGAVLPNRAAGQPQPDDPGAKLAKDLIGTWTLAEAETPGEPSGVGTRLKFYTGTHWSITQHDPKTGKVVFHHGGRYTVRGDTMEVTIEYANESTASLIGQKHQFKVSVADDSYKQTGLDNPFTETWKRVK